MVKHACNARAWELDLWSSVGQLARPFCLVSPGSEETHLLNKFQGGDVSSGTTFHIHMHTSTKITNEDVNFNVNQFFFSAQIKVYAFVLANLM